MVLRNVQTFHLMSNTDTISISGTHNSEKQFFLSLVT